jgi:hypothetical protein
MNIRDTLEEYVRYRSKVHFVSVATLKRLNAALDKLEEETDERQAMAILDEVIRERWLD